MVRDDGRPIDRDRLVRMREAIRHRGPDGEGIWIKEGVGLAHRRLAIVDLSPTGAQPMMSADGNTVVTFNGEIYNYRELREELIKDGLALRSTSDTEVLLLLYEKFGEGMLDRLHGMFAFVLWDTKRKHLFFARDRIGKKPFFYRQTGKEFFFASEIKALLTEDAGSKIDWEAVRVFFGLQYVPAPQTGYHGILSLPPGHCGTFADGKVEIRRYHTPVREPVFSGSRLEAVGEVRRLTERAVHLRMIADVPVGAFLSGGVDSSVVASLMAQESSLKIQTFTMGFPNLGFDERAEARALAKRLGTEHHEFEAHPEAAVALVDDLVRLYESPYADSSCLPTWLLAQETSKHVKAVMTGDGGDELFAGYRRYGYFSAALSLARLGPIASVFSSGLKEAARLFKDPRALRFARTLEASRDSVGRGYAALFSGSYFSAEEEAWLLQPDFFHETERASARHFIEAHFDARLGWRGALAFDTDSYLPDDLNVKMDRATMAHALEARSPFLDQDLAAFVSRLPKSFLYERGKVKPLVRAAFLDMLPAEIFERPKRGFQIPLAEWFRARLRPLFLERCLAEGSPLHAVCRPEAVKSYLEANDRGADHGNRLWMLLVLSTWLLRAGRDSSQTV